MQLEWIDFYTEFATKLLMFKNDRKTLIDKIQNVYHAVNIKMPKLEQGNEIIDIDPFTVFGLFNKNIINAKRIAIIHGMIEEFGIAARASDNLDGIPVLSNVKSVFYCFKDERTGDDIDNLWAVFEAALLLVDSDTKENRQKFSSIYNKVHDQRGIHWNIIMGLYWIRPYFFINLDSKNKQYMINIENMPAEFAKNMKEKLYKLPYAAEYLEIRDNCQKILASGNYPYKSFPELSYYAWTAQEQAEIEKGAEEKKEKEKQKQSIRYPLYSSKKFLKEVYMEEEDYRILTAIVRNKKNVILQGAPGVGKTFAAERLAYSMMGMKDSSRVMMVQFHQSYSYEDFIMGFRPSAAGFELKTGVFYNFCKKAELDNKREYFFIIDEINRGNLSKIFGELFMLIENDKRGTSLQLLYSDEKFSVPKNIYIIGMMNTADRSLAMLDYALRRRFAFFEIHPGFQTKGFQKYRNSLDNKKFNNLINCVEKLNHVISRDESLGEGFCIGHSYFCNLRKESLDRQCLSNIVEFELIPLLREYWFDEPLKVKEWSSHLRGAIT